VALDKAPGCLSTGWVRRLVVVGVSWIVAGCGLILDTDPADPSATGGRDGGRGEIRDAGQDDTGRGGTGDGATDAPAADGPPTDAARPDAGGLCGFPPMRLDSSGQGQKPRIAWSGRDFGVVWLDHRSGESSEVWYTSVGVTGAVFSSERRLSVEGEGAAGAPAIDFGAGTYGVAWTVIESPGANGVMLGIFNRDGSVDHAPRLVSIDTSGAAHVSIVWAPELGRYGLVWDDRRFGPPAEIMFRQANESGMPLGVEQRVTSSVGDAVHPAIAWSGSRFGVVWADDAIGGRKIVFAQVDGAAALLPGELTVHSETVTPDPDAEPEIAFADGAYGVVWYDLQSTGAQSAFLSRVDALGALLPGEVELTVGRTDERIIADDPVIDGAPGRFVTAWEDDRDPGETEIYYSEATVSGRARTTNARLTSDSIESDTPSIVWTGSGVAVVWEEGTDPSAEIWMAYWCPPPAE
jgi:hypothetical protein